MPKFNSNMTSKLLPLNTFFFTIFDLKLGSEIITWFAVLNKVAGLYGLLAVFTGGTLLQLSMYLYSVATLAIFSWGARQLGEENPAKVLTYSHFYFIDHAISTLYTVFFGVAWYVYTPHDGRRIANSQAQKDISGGASDGYAGGAPLDDAERTRLALQIWNDERGFSTTVLVLGWLVKIYFIAILYSYAIHLRRGTFRALLAQHQASKAAAAHASNPTLAAAAAAAARRPSSALNNHSSSGGGYAYSHLRNQSSLSGGGMNGGNGSPGPDGRWDEDDGNEGENTLFNARDEESIGRKDSR